MDDGDERMTMEDDQWQIIDGDDWWRTSYTSVSWAPSPTARKKVAVLPPLAVDDPPVTHEDTDLSLSCSLPGVQGALGALDRYEADVGFYYSQSSKTTSVSDLCHCDGMNKGRWNELITDLFGDIPTYAASSSASSRGTPSPCPSASTSSVSSSSAASTSAPNTPASKLNASANSFVPTFVYPVPSQNHKIKITKDEQGFYMGVDEEDERDEIEEEIRNIIGSYEGKANIVFAPFAPDERKSPDSDDDAFVVKMPKRRVLEDDEGWIGFGEKDKVQRKKDLFDALTRRCRSAVPDKTSTTEGWIEPKRQSSVAPAATSAGWIELESASPPRDPKPPVKESSSKQSQWGKRSRQPPKTHKRGGSSVSSFSSTSSRSSSLPAPLYPLPTRSGYPYPMFNPQAYAYPQIRPYFYGPHPGYFQPMVNYRAMAGTRMW
ncbi:uncharacterized protein EV420DRAFT_1479386 [Desarmillaria tabescens]|uniref:Uncharacterized protein n=1 Tax=Armillaria tabescens TaxID=1929756 RepID=A0AA39N6T5_ARMTA|nr:uncharacterized protein EV420DRAFT_1486901 [Desarmillaria tabescens]XP_060331636.1 uncharacterized protein EV420DRAFT_1479386 [Desarmillaria tabescens]KAK0437946.1 hypothetical protein EV420DRAFT_1486901 [Desarmillaria tabescens]KAK0459410.1 hypothetical protein EV420DRAFT_1479386 [Desarmillaria tabescens]